MIKIIEEAYFLIHLEVILNEKKYLKKIIIKSIAINLLITGI